MTRASKLLNKYEVEMLVTSDRDIDYNNFYKEELIAFCKCLRECNKKQQEIIDKANNYCHSEIDKCKYEQSDDEWECCIEELKGVLSILEDKEV